MRQLCRQTGRVHPSVKADIIQKFSLRQACLDRCFQRPLAVNVPAKIPLERLTSIHDLRQPVGSFLKPIEPTDKADVYNPSVARTPCYWRRANRFEGLI